MNKSFFAVLLLGNMASSAWADAQENADALAKAIEEARCVITPLNGDAIREASGLDHQDYMDAAMHLYGAGKFEQLSNSVITAFRSENCANQGIEGDTLVYVELIESHGCQMTDEVAQIVMPETGFEKDQVKQILAELVAKGLAETDGQEMHLTTENCR